MLRRSGRAAAIVILLFAVTSSTAGAGPSTAHEATTAEGIVYVDGVERWRGQEVTSGLAWSERHDALAFAGRDGKGDARLVVLIVDDRLEAAAFSWRVPAAAQPALAVAWVGERRVGAGPSELGPAMVAEYRLGR